jgi:enoyl-CoA hydratase/3-hydroxypropionyl-coenzyme A dehydratase
VAWVVLCCDIVIANQFAKLGLSEIKLGSWRWRHATQCRCSAATAPIFADDRRYMPASNSSCRPDNEIVDTDRLMRAAGADDRRRAHCCDRGAER